MTCLVCNGDLVRAPGGAYVHADAEAWLRDPHHAVLSDPEPQPEEVK